MQRHFSSSFPSPWLRGGFHLCHRRGAGPVASQRWRGGSAENLGSGGHATASQRCASHPSVHPWPWEGGAGSLFADKRRPSLVPLRPGEECWIILRRERCLKKSKISTLLSLEREKRRT